MQFARGGGGASAQAQPAGGARIFIDGDPGFSIYLTAAIREKHVAVAVTTDRSKADYVLEETSDHLKATGWKNSIVGDWTAPALPQLIKGNDSASIRLVDIKTSDVIFAYSVDRNNSFHGRQTAAESCAKHLKLVASSLRGTSPVTPGSISPAEASLGARLSAWPAKPNSAFPWPY